MAHHISKWIKCKKCKQEFWGYTAKLCPYCKSKKYRKRRRNMVKIAPIEEYNYKVVGYQDQVEHQLLDATLINIIASNSGKALDKAKKMIKKKHYRVSEVHEIVKNKDAEQYNFQHFLWQKQNLKESKRSNNLLEKLIRVLERRKYGRNK